MFFKMLQKKLTLNLEEEEEVKEQVNQIMHEPIKTAAATNKVNQRP